MRAMQTDEHGGLRLRTDMATPEPGVGQVRVRVRATAVNRADLMQRAGSYPAPADAPADILGLEYAGEVDALGSCVKEVAVGQRVFGLVGGGSYAEYVVVPERALSPMPEGMSFEDAAALPEAFLTAYDAMVSQGGLSAGMCVLVHAAASGVGTAAVQIARAIGAQVIATARTEEKLAQVKALGADHVICVQDASFADRVLAVRPAGVDVVLELVGGNYVSEDLRAVAPLGRIVLVGLVGGRAAEIDLGLVLKKRARVMGTVLRARPLEEKIAIHQVLKRQLVPLFERGLLVPVIDQVLELADADTAHQRMKQNLGTGKLVLRV